MNRLLLLGMVMVGSALEADFSDLYPSNWGQPKKITPQLLEQEILLPTAQSIKKTVDSYPIEKLPCELQGYLKTISRNPVEWVVFSRSLVLTDPRLKIRFLQALNNTKKNGSFDEYKQGMLNELSVSGSNPGKMTLRDDIVFLPIIESVWHQGQFIKKYRKSLLQDLDLAHNLFSQLWNDRALKADLLFLEDAKYLKQPLWRAAAGLTPQAEDSFRYIEEPYPLRRDYGIMRDWKARMQLQAQKMSQRFQLYTERVQQRLQNMKPDRIKSAGDLEKAQRFYGVYDQ